MSYEWSWLVSAALFFGGLAGGSYVSAFGGYLLNEEKYRNFSKVGYLIAFPSAILCVLLLAVDLGTPTRFINIRNMTSMIMLGSIILGFFILLSLLTIIGSEESVIFPQITFVRRTRLILGGISSFFALGTVMYTALLLGASFGRPFWGTPLLPYLFLVSGVLSGLAAIGLGLLIREEWRESITTYKVEMATSDISFHFLELFILILYLGTVNAPTAVEALITGDLNSYFILGVLVIGLIIPLILALYSIQKKAVSNPLTGFTFALVLIGGFLLRYVIVVGGQIVPSL